MPRQTCEEVVPPHLDAAFNDARWLTRSDADAEDAAVGDSDRHGHDAAGARPRTAPGDPPAAGDANGGGIVMCLEAGRLLDAFVDHELGPAESADLQAHLASCAACGRLLADRESLGRLVRQLPYYPAPDQLRAKISRMSARRRFNPGLLAWAAVLALAVALGGAVEVVRFARARQVVETTASVADEVVGDHVRALRDAHLFDVRSSDQHTVKPWFLGKLDFSPPVEDLSSIGFPLVGGRLDHVAGRPVAALVYQRRLHPINVYIWPAADRTAASDTRTIRGFQVRHWIRNGMSFWAVSDLNDAELSEFVRALQR